jgi:two-component system, OmpR family, response regulator
VSTPGKILIIDDSDVILDRVRQTLSGAGYDVITSNQTVGNARHLKNCDLVILDFHMPGIDGADVLQGFRKAASNTTCLFYLYTSDNSVADDFARLGFDGSFRQKGNDAALLSQVTAVFRMRRMASLSGKAPPGRNR